MSRYLLIHEGYVLPELAQDEVRCAKPSQRRSNYPRAKWASCKRTRIGQSPYTTFREAMGARADWAATLGGCLGTVKEGEIEIVRLVSL
jgi:hypothetical protein